MATTFVEYTGDGQASKQFTFPSYQESDVKVRVDGVLKDTSTHYNITNYTTTGGGFVVFTSGNIPSSPANIRIYRDTNVDTAKATFTAGSSVKAADLNNNTTQLLYRAQEEQIPNLIHSYDIDDGAVTEAKIADSSITTAKIGSNQVNAATIIANAVTEAKIANGAVTATKLAADSVTNAKIADDSIDSEHYVDGSIDTAHIGNSQVTTAKIADSNITTAKIAADAVTGAKIADDQINSEHYVDGSIDTAHIADAQVTTAKLATDAVTRPKLADNSVGSSEILANAVTASELADNAVETAKINNSAVTSAKIANSTIVAGNIANETILDVNIAGNAALNGAKFLDDSITMAKLSSGALPTDITVASANLLSNSVTTDKIADGELTTLAGMQSGTASKLADSTALTADIADLNQIDGMAKQTTITDDDTKFPTSGAVVDYVAAQLEPFGGFEAIANESSFPNTQPVSGVAISIADAGGMSVSNSGTASGATVGGTTVNISGIPSNFHSSTVAAGIRFIVTSTGSGQNYTYHKATLKEDDLLNLSGDINDFSERYRVGSSNPTTSLDSGDLFFNTGTGKLLVYNGTNSAWEEAQSVGNFFINTISSSSATGGGSATPNGTAYRFTLSNAGTNAEQHLVSVDGVIQKPNSGSSQPSEGFAVSGSDIIFGSAPVSGASIFVITIGSTVNIGTPSNNTVTSAILQNGSVTTAKIVDANVTTAKIADSAVTNAKIANGAVGTNKLASGAVGSSEIAAGSIVNSNISSSAAIAGTKISPDFGSQNITTSGEIEITGSNTVIKFTENDANPDFGFLGNGGLLRVQDLTNTANIMVFGPNNVQCIKNLDLDNGLDVSGNITVTGTVDGVDIAALNTTVSNLTTDLVSDTTPQLGGTLDTNGQLISFGDSTGSTVNRLNFGTGNDLNIYHEGNHSYIRDSGTGSLILVGSNVTMQNAAMSANMFSATESGSVAIYHNGNRKLETTATGVFNDGKLGVNTSTTDKADLLVNNATFEGSHFAYSNDRVALQTAGELKGLAMTSTYNDGTYPGYGIMMVQGPNTNSYNVWGLCPDGPAKGSNLNLHYGGYSGSGSRPNIHNPNLSKFVFTSGGNFNPPSNGTGSLGTDGVRWGLINTNKIRVDVSSTSGTGSGNVEGIFLRNTNETDGNAVAIFGGADDYSNAGSAINFVNVDHSANVGQIQFDTRSSSGYAGRVQITSDGHLRPVTNNTYDLGGSSQRWRNVYTNDLHLSNKGHANDVDGSWGDWTIQEGESDLFLKNNRSGKKYKFNLTEVS